MPDEKANSLAEKLAALQRNFHQQLPGRIADLECLWKTVDMHGKHDSLAEFHRMVHSLAGSGGTFGAVAVSNTARELEFAIKNCIENENDIQGPVSQEIETLLLRLKDTALQWRPSSVPGVLSIDKDDSNNKNRLVFIVEDDDLLARSIASVLENDNYVVRVFGKLDDFEEALGDETPAVVIMDMGFDEGEFAGAESITRMNMKFNYKVPVVFISVRSDIEARLAATRAGAHRYFIKPLDNDKLLSTLSGLVSYRQSDPYRILLIDDDKPVLDYYAAVLRDAGMEVKALSEPLQGLETAEKFKPDLLLLDVYMPGCSGLELAQVIRQDDYFAQTPIMFLSTESDLDRQILALDLGGDDFINKPVLPEHLVAAVTARVKRARLINRLNQDLKQALRESEYRHITLDQHAIVSIADPQGNITFANDKFCEVSGFSLNDLTGQPYKALMSWRHDKDFYENLWETISQGSVWHGVICNRNRNNTEYWLETTIVPFLDDKGAPYQYISASTDITGLRTSEERLNRSQVFANIGTWDWNIKTGDLFWSERIGPLFGYGEVVTEARYEGFLAAVHPDDRQSVIDAVNACVEKGDDYNIEHRVVWPDGTIHWLHESGDVLRDKDGNALNMLGVVRDITQRKQAQLALEESEHRLREAQKLGHLGDWSMEMGSAKIHWSDEVYRIYGFTPGEIEPTYKLFLDCLHPEDRKFVRRIQESVFDGHDKTSMNHRLILRDGSVRWVHVEAIPVFDEKGRPVILQGTIQDVTEVKQAEESLRKAKEEAENANRAKSEFLSSMSHELRTPLNAIMGFSQLMQMESEQLSESNIESIDEILKAGKHLLALIDDVLDLAKIEAKGISFSINPVEYGDVLMESLSLIAGMASRRNVEITIKKNEEIIDAAMLDDLGVFVMADRTRLKQVVLNLLTNAVKYNRENGKILIACDNRQNGMIRFSVSDTGRGISPDKQLELFKSFNRLGAERTEIEGTGIGLVISKNIVELMGGHIGVESKVDKGSTFWFDLPAESDAGTCDNRNAVN